MEDSLPIKSNSNIGLINGIVYNKGKEKCLCGNL